MLAIWPYFGWGPSEGFFLGVGEEDRSKINSCRNLIGLLKMWVLKNIPRSDMFEKTLISVWLLSIKSDF